MADCTCAPAHGCACPRASSLPCLSSAATAGPAPAAPLTSAAMRNQCERATAPVTAVHGFLSLLGDCSSANTGQQSGMRMESLAVVLRDLAEQLAEAEPLIDEMAAIGRDTFPGSGLSSAIEAHGYTVFTVRHSLCLLYDAIGASCRYQHEVDAGAFGGTLFRMVDRLQAVEAGLTAIAFPARAVAPAASAGCAPVETAEPSRSTSPATVVAAPPAPAPIPTRSVTSSKLRARVTRAGKRSSVRASMEASS